MNSLKVVTFFTKTALTLSLFVGSMSFASYERTTAVGIDTDTTQLNHSFGYSFSSDAFDQSKQTLINHGARYTGTYFFMNKKYYTTFGLGALFQSVDNGLVQNDNGSLQLTDLVLGFGTSAWSLYQSNSDRLSLFTSLSNIAPLSETSRNEGYKSVPSVRADLAYQRGRLDLVLTGQFTYVFNSYDTNTMGNSNLETSLSSGFSVRYNLKHFRFQYSYIFGVLNYLDGTSLGSSGNNYSITGIINNNLWVSASTSNVNNVDEQFVDVWFYDPFVRIYSLSMGVTF